MIRLEHCLNNPIKTQFFSHLSNQFYSSLPTDILTLFEGPETNRRPYIIFEPLLVSEAFCKAIRESSEEFWSMAVSTANIFQYLPESEILDWGYPEDYIPQIWGCSTPPSEMRLDIAVNPKAFEADIFRLSDFKVLETNSATPGFWAETFVLNQSIAQHFGKQCPNNNMGIRQTQDFIDYLQSSFPAYLHGSDRIYFSFPYSGEHEDIVSFDARMGYFEALGGMTQFLYVEDLILESDKAKNSALLSKSGEEVKYLFLHYPNEWLLEDEGTIVTDESLHSVPSDRPWDYIEELVLKNELFRVPPMSSEIIQNKAFFAFLWEGVRSNRFNVETTQIIQQLIPQTYCTMDEATKYGLRRIWEKPIYGREGAGVILWEDGKELVNTYDRQLDEDDWYQNMLAVFQQDCEMPVKQFDDQDLTLMFTVYLSAQGRATGIGCRAVPQSSQVVDAQNGLWQPLGMR